MMRAIITDVCDGCGVENERFVEGVDGMYDGVSDGWSTLHMERPIAVTDPSEQAAVQAVIDSGGDADAARSYFANLRAHGVGRVKQTLRVNVDLCPTCANGGDYRAIVERIAAVMIEDHEKKMQNRPHIMHGLYETPRPADLDDDLDTHPSGGVSLVGHERTLPS